MDTEQPRFEELVGRLEAAVTALESGTLDLDAALAQYQVGLEMVARSRQLLHAAEQRVSLIAGTGDDGRPLLKPFENGS